MPEILTQYGLPALFLLSFCAAMLLPLDSEWLLVASGKTARYALVASLTLASHNLD